MPKVTLQFDCPDENNELMNALHGTDYKIVLGDVAQTLRNAQKYGHEFKTPDDVIEYLRKQIRESCVERNIDVY